MSYTYIILCESENQRCMVNKIEYGEAKKKNGLKMVLQLIGKFSFSNQTKQYKNYPFFFPF